MWSGGPGITSEDTPTPAVNPGPMTIYVKTGTGHTLTLTVQPTDTIQSVKIKIQIQIHITPNQQILTFGNVHLESGQTLVHYLIVSGSTLHVTWRIPTEHQLKENCGACDMRIFVRPMTGQTLTLHVAATDTIQITKIRIQIQISIEPSAVLFFFSSLPRGRADGGCRGARAPIWRGNANGASRPRALRWAALGSAVAASAFCASGHAPKRTVRTPAGAATADVRWHAASRRPDALVLLDRERVHIRPGVGVRDPAAGSSPVGTRQRTHLPSYPAAGRSGGCGAGATRLLPERVSGGDW